MNNDVLFFVAFYSLMGVFVSLIIVGSDLNGPPMSKREVIKIIVAGLLWPFFILVGAAHVCWELLKAARSTLAKIAHDITRIT